MNPRRACVSALLVWLGLVTSVSGATVVRLWVFGDSTVKDYKNSQDACSSVLEIAGWGQYIMEYLGKDSLANLANVIVADSVVLQNRANGGRAARSFITGADSAILRTAYANMKRGDYMLIQFGHNDESLCSDYPDRCTSIADYKKFLGMYVDSVRSKGATPILVTPMVRNAWPEYNTHDNGDGSKSNQQAGNFALAMQQVAKDRGVPSVDLTQRSIDLFNTVGDDATKYRHFRKVRAGTALPSGCASINDGTHFQPNGAREMARLIHQGLRSLREVKVTIPDTAQGTVLGYSNGVKDKANQAWIQLTNDFRKGSGWYESDHNPSVKIEARPKTGYVFTGWSGDVKGATNPMTLSMARSYAIVASFAKIGTHVAPRIGNTAAKYDAAARALKVHLDAMVPAKVGVYALDGTPILRRAVPGPADAVDFALPLGALPTGLYLLRSEQGGVVGQDVFFVP